MLECDKCGGHIAPGSKFCPHCGDPVTDEDKPVASSKASSPGKIDIEFGYSSSANLETAVELCKRHPSYRESGEDRAKTHRVSIDAVDVELATNIWELVGGWKSSKLIIDGQRASRSDLVQGGLGCYQTRQRSYDIDSYCFGEEPQVNFWGCKSLRLPLYDWGGGWLEYGEMDRNGYWHFDKDRIRHEIEAAIHRLRHCPILDRDKILDLLDRLPDQVNPRTDPAWEYRTSWEQVGGDYKEVPVGVRPVTDRVMEVMTSGSQESARLIERQRQRDAVLRDLAKRNESENRPVPEIPRVTTENQVATGDSGNSTIVAIGAVAILVLIALAMC